MIEGTSVCGRVFASELAQVRDTSVNVPLAGVTITVDGMEETLRTTTDSKGNFCLSPAPAGRFFVHIDGRTATNGVPSGSYYPFVGKAWESTIGQQTNVGTAYLPLVPEGTLQAVSQSQDTTIHLADSVLEQFPDFADVTINVPADSLYADDGTRGGMVGIAPVPPDRLPGQLPENLNFPVVITVQTDGATNFDEPAPVCFPNLPDPVTDELLPPGTENALFSFDHDTGRWSAVGSMTVSADGQLICTDPDVGIRAPGWHGSGPPPVGPPPPPPPPCQINPAKIQCLQDATVFYGICVSAAAAACATGVGCVGSAIAIGACSLTYAYQVSVVCDRLPNCLLATSLATSGVQDALTGDPIADQIGTLSRQMVELMYPFVLAGETIPDDIQNQIDDLATQMNDVAGGDAVQYMRDLLLQIELENANLEESFGNAPPYSVLYAAQIQRSDGQDLILRGQTDAYGQYSLFVPRDGELLYVSFYDPQTNSWGVVPSRAARCRISAPSLLLTTCG